MVSSSRLRHSARAACCLAAALSMPAPSPGGGIPGEPVCLTTDGRLKFSPVFFDGGREIIFADFESPELFRLQRLNLASKKIEPLHPSASKSEFEPSVSADGRFYAYLRPRGVL